jgi:hypothetical protein
MGPIQDRTKENLVSADNGIIMTRIRLRKAALALMKGELPAGRDPKTQRVRPAAIELPPDASFKDAIKDGLMASENGRTVWI